MIPGVIANGMPCLRNTAYEPRMSSRGLTHHKEGGALPMPF